jgi:peptide/nickel transport system permease protein
MSRTRKLREVAKVVGKAVLVFVLATFGITVLVRLLPGDPAETLLPFGTPDQHEALRQELGLDRNIVIYYFNWLWDFVRGDFGVFYNTSGEGGTEVSTLIANSLPRSLLIMLYTMLFSLMVSIPLGMLLGYKADTKTDKVGSNLVFALSSIPNFVIGLVLMLFLSIKIEWLEPVGYTPIGDGISAHLKSVLMPVLALSVGLIATQTRLLRADVISTLKEDFITMASSKGLSNKWILWRHAFRPSSLTLMTSAALNMGALIGGAVVIESLFAIDGFGLLLTSSLNYRQYLAIQSIVALIALGYILFNAIVDGFYAVVDPRVRSGRESA